MLKIIIIGEVAVGKTTLLQKYSGVTLTQDQDWIEKSVAVGDQTVKLRICDTAGQENFRNITSSYYHGSDAVILVYSVASRETFEKLNNWLDDIHLYGKQGVPKFLVGNKIDLVDREVPTAEGKELMAKKNLDGFIETSAETGQNLDQLFIEMATKLSKIDGFAPATKRLAADDVVIPNQPKKTKCDIL